MFATADYSRIYSSGKTATVHETPIITFVKNYKKAK